MRKTRLLPSFACTTWLACSCTGDGGGKAADAPASESDTSTLPGNDDTGDHGGDTGDSAESTAPVLTLSTTLLDFESIDYDAEAQLSLELENTGVEDLQITAVSLETATVFSISDLETTTLTAGSTTALTVTFRPEDGASFTDQLLVQSNDPDNPTQLVTLAGVGLLSTIELSPAQYDFGSVYLGCTDTVEISVSNVGNGDLTVTSVELNSASTEFSVDTTALGELPWTVPPATSVLLPLRYTPTDDLSTLAYLFVESSDPFIPETMVIVEARGEVYATGDDRFEQGSTPTDSFSLSQTPVPDSIHVLVDGRTTTVGWTWEAATNRVVFDAASVPDEGASIAVRYVVGGPC